MSGTLREAVMSGLKKGQRPAFAALAGVLLLATIPGSAAGQDGWQFALTPYGWATGLKGTTTTGQTKSDLDVGFDDVLDNLEMGGMVDARLEKGRWAIQSNLVWADLESETTQDGVRIKGDVDLWVIEAEGRYRLTDHWEVLAGMRYYDLDVHIRAVGVGSAGMDEKWIDPIVGAAFSIPLSQRWSFRARGDDRFGMDTYMTGPVAGVCIRF